MVHDPLMFLSETDDSSRLDIVEIARVAWHASFQPL